MRSRNLTRGLGLLALVAAFAILAPANLHVRATDPLSGVDKFQADCVAMPGNPPTGSCKGDQIGGDATITIANFSESSDLTRGTLLGYDCTGCTTPAICHLASFNATITTAGGSTITMEVD